MANIPPNGREPMRGPDESRPGSVDHVERAKRRMAEIRAVLGDNGISDEVYFDKFFAEAPAGWAYNWKTFEVFGKAYPQYFAQLQKNFWSPVPAHRHRELLYPEYEGENIIIDGAILMERPKELNDRMAQIEKNRVLAQVRQKEAVLTEAPEGTAPRGTSAFTKVRLSSHTGPVVPD